jgi:hypothetical protein
VKLSLLPSVSLVETRPHPWHQLIRTNLPATA